MVNQVLRRLDYVLGPIQLPTGDHRAQIGPRLRALLGRNPGFDITVTRTRKHDGKALPDDVLTTQYAADNDIVCS